MHLFCLKDKKQVNKSGVFLLAKVSFTLALLRVTLVNALPNVVRFLRVFRFLPTRNVDRIVRIIKISLTLRNLSNQRPVKRGKL